MLERVLMHLYGPRHYNWPITKNGLHTGSFTIKDGSIALPSLLEGQYFRIVGSVFNDGIHRYTDELSLTDETFEGAVWALRIHKDLIKLVQEIEEWEAKNAAAAGPYQSESFGGYSYTKATDSVTGGAVTWQTAFRSRLNVWRKI